MNCLRIIVNESSLDLFDGSIFQIRDSSRVTGWVQCQWRKQVSHDLWADGGVKEGKENDEGTNERISACDRKDKRLQAAKMKRETKSSFASNIFPRNSVRVCGNGRGIVAIKTYPIKVFRVTALRRVSSSENVILSAVIPSIERYNRSKTCSHIDFAIQNREKISSRMQDSNKLSFVYLRFNSTLIATLFLYYFWKREI